MKKNKLKVLTVVGTRPEIIRLSEVIKELRDKMQLVLVHTGQNYDYELNEIFFKELSLDKPDYFLSAAGKSPAETVGSVISKVDHVLEKERPDALLVLGDTNSCMAAYAAKRRHIPIFHMEAGNRCFDQRVPEETNRRLIDHLSDINLVYSERARENLVREGLSNDCIIKTGSPMYEVLYANKKNIDKSKILTRLSLKENNYIVVSAHREENVDEESNLKALVGMISDVSERYKSMKIVFSVHPRTEKRLQSYGAVLPKNLIKLKPLGFIDYVQLQKNSFCVLSDSGTITEESSILNFPAVNIRETHERMEGMDEGAVIMAGIKNGRVLEAIELAVQQKGNIREFNIPQDYNVSNVSKKVARIILSYVDYVNRKIWMKSGLN